VAKTFLVKAVTTLWNILVFRESSIYGKKRFCKFLIKLRKTYCAFKYEKQKKANKGNVFLVCE